MIEIPTIIFVGSLIISVIIGYMIGVRSTMFMHRNTYRDYTMSMTAEYKRILMKFGIEKFGDTWKMRDMKGFWELKDKE